jgi:hypothetical protein
VCRRERQAIAMKRLAALTVVGIALAGCGGGEQAQPSSKPAYERKVQAIQQQVFAKVNPATILASAQASDTARALSVVVQATDDEARELEDIVPPAEIAAAHQRLIGGMKQYAHDLSIVVRNLRDGKLAPADLRLELASLASLKTIREARAAIAAKGYNIG